jgi:hypothetical protein
MKAESPYADTKRVMLNIRVDHWLTIERLATAERREARDHAAILLERIAADAEAHPQAA